MAQYRLQCKLPINYIIGMALVECTLLPRSITKPHLIQLDHDFYLNLHKIAQPGPDFPHQEPHIVKKHTHKKTNTLGLSGLCLCRTHYIPDTLLKSILDEAHLLCSLTPRASRRFHHLDVTVQSVEHAALSANTGVTSVSARPPIGVVLRP